jgi:hypothetical protein
MEPDDVPILPRDLAAGQVAEWQVWSRLVATSGGDLHVFLPLDDRGIDGIVHRISTDAYARVQVKGRGNYRHGAIQLLVPEDELADDRATLVAVSLDLAEPELGGRALVIEAPAFKELARRYAHPSGVRYYVELRFAAPPPPWAPWIVPLDEMGERLLPAGPEPALAPVALPVDRVAAKRMGYRAEMELLRRAADCSTLNVFKAHPDLEPNEYLVYELESRGVVGIQVKSASFSPGARKATVSVYRMALRPSPHTWFVVFLAEHGSSEFLPDCAVIPSMVVAESLAGSRMEGKLSVARGFTGRLAPWRLPLAELGRRLADVAASAGR